ncbi:MAG: hypothetical protein QXF40_02445 [Metallosphaera sp.]|uniref:hypothetical protein n=1 Tax=Metallosphaera sp. TaxID=2020860 RepID=UPI00316060AB
MIENIDLPSLNYKIALSYITNPFFFVGSLGHVGILRVYDVDVQDYAIPSEAKTPDYTKFHVAYIFGKSRPWIKLGGGVKTKEGFLNGPSYSALGLSYKGKTLDEDNGFEIILSTGNNEKTRIVFNVNEKLGVWNRLNGFSFSDLVEHMVNAHLVPALERLSDTRSL